MKIVKHVADVRIKGKVEVDKQQHLYFATNRMQAMYLCIYTKAFRKGSRFRGFILWYDEYDCNPTFVENLLSNY